MSQLQSIDFGHRQLIVRREPAVALRAAVRSVAVVATLAAGTLAMAVVALGLGEYPVSPTQVVSILTGQDQSFASVLVLQWRIPRILLAILIGAALGVSGAIFQAMTRNPLGSPDVIGFDFGAYTGALIAIAVLGGGYYTVAVSAVVGGVATAAVVYLLSYKNGVAGFRLIIVGIAVSAVLSSFCLLVAVAAATAGPISFVALAAPQLARRLTSAPGVGLVSAAAMGAFLLLASDLIALRIFAPTELPVGAVTVTVGGMYLVYLLVAQARRG